ncbi:hypothetical protein EII38_07470 [Streptococcus minor]|uniref:Foldase n=1 Tax=Streptococcus minor TaxID=229549 RepID=A0A3P1VBI0_9STRE|nr:cell wall synthase accessory phosphoprotein MacP [Streptococcus minor]RRD31108.1 hypothetical protein EII38_07470 [Streptococcus minor]
MGKPLLTDEVLERARRHKDREGEFGYYSPNSNRYEDEDLYDEYDEYDEDEYAPYEYDWDDEYQGYEEGQTVRIPVEQSIVKSRRIETVKREEFRTKVNKILFGVVFLVILFLLAVFYL